MLNELCSADADKLCSDVTPGEGRVQECLRSHREQLSWDCQALVPLTQATLLVPPYAYTAAAPALPTVCL